MGERSEMNMRNKEEKTNCKSKAETKHDENIKERVIFLELYGKEEWKKKRNKEE